MSSSIIAVLVIVSIVLVIVLTSKFKINAFITLFLASLFLAVTALPGRDVINIIKDGFGSTMGSIGLLIILGAIIAVILDKTGGALSIAKFILSKSGDKNATAALGITGFIAGLPIFCDSGFIILSGLAKSLSAKAKIAMPFIAVVLGCSLYSVHCLIPPHPGALAAAGIMSANVGLLILTGTLLAIPIFIIAYFWVKWRTNKKGYRHAHESHIIQDHGREVLPPVFLSFLPILVPILLIAISSILKLFEPGNKLFINRFLFFLGNPVIALSVGALLSLLLLKGKGDKLNTLFEQAIEKAGTILIVTAAGGMFGMVIKETGIGTEAGSLLSKTGLGLAIPFLIAFVMKTAQGSSTVAIITTASIITPMLPMLGLDSEWGKILTMLSMGAGSMMISHANDSYFWVITRFSEIHADITLKVFSSATIVMGLTGFLMIWLLSMIVL